MCRSITPDTANLNDEDLFTETTKTNQSHCGQLVSKLQTAEDGVVSMDQVIQLISGPNKGNRSVWYAMREVFPNAILKNKSFSGVRVITADDETLAVPLEDNPGIDFFEDTGNPKPAMSGAPYPQLLACNSSARVSVSTQTESCAPCDCTDNVIRSIQGELTELAKLSNPSILRTAATDLHTLEYAQYEHEFNTRTPTLSRVLYESVNRKKTTLPEHKRTAVTTVLCKYSNIYCQYLNSYQKQLGLMLRSSNATKQTINKLCKLYDCISYQQISKILNGYSKETDSLMEKWGDEEVMQCGDNLDVRSNVRYEGDGKSYHDIHMYNHIIYKSPIPTTDLSDEIPEVDLSTISYDQFLLSTEEEDSFLGALKFVVVDSWHRNVAETAHPIPPANKYSELMKCKTEKLHAGVIMKNESKTDEMIEILEYCSKYPTPDNPRKCPNRGDVGTYRVMKKALNSSDKNLRFVPCIGGFHLQMEWVQLIFDLHFDEQSGRDPTGLFALKSLLNSKQVKVDIRKNYYAANYFLDKVLDALLIEAAFDKFGEVEVAGCDSGFLPSEVMNIAADELVTQMYNHEHMKLPSDKCPVCSKNYKHYTTLKKHILQKHPQHLFSEASAGQQRDLKNSECMQLLKLLVLKRCLDHSIKSGNGQLLSLLMKHMMLYFHTLGYKNYALACFEHVGQCQIFLSPRMRELIVYDCFVNNTGKPLNCTAMDKDLEHANLFFKQSFRLAASNPKQELLDLYSKAQNKLEMVQTQFYKQFNIKDYPSERTVDTEAYKRDVLKVSEHLRKHNLFTVVTGRSFVSDKLNKAAHDPLVLVDMYKLVQWFKLSIARMTEQVFLQRPN